VPEGVTCERGWRCLRGAGTIEFSVVGVLAALAMPLAEVGLGVFAVSTFDTDYLLLKGQDLPAALEALRRAGHVVEERSPAHLPRQARQTARRQAMPLQPPGL
jgi:hypothetical protein